MWLVRGRRVRGTGEENAGIGEGRLRLRWWFLAFVEFVLGRAFMA